MGKTSNEAKARWDKKNTSRVMLKLNNNTDKDILEELSETPNKQGYIKSLIRQDIASKKSQP